MAKYKLPTTMKKYKLSQAVTVKRPDPNETGLYGSVTLPAGLRVQPVYPNQKPPSVYFLDQFPADLFPPFSFELHDAVHYGIRIPAEFVETCEQAV